ncbi:uncharacterized protein GJ701_006083 isoform 2-T3 [Geothlypis trichas]
MGILERELGEKRGYCSWSAERRESAGNVVWAACEPRPSSLEQGHLRMSHRDSAITPGIHFEEHKVYNAEETWGNRSKCCPGCLSVLPRRKGSLCLACPAQLDVAGLCGLARQEQLAVLWSALEPSLAALEGFLFGTACDTPSLCTKSSGKGLTGQEQSPNSSHLGQNLGCWSSQSQEASAPGAALEGSGPAHAGGESEGHRAPLLLCWHQLPGQCQCCQPSLCPCPQGCQGEGRARI